MTTTGSPSRACIRHAAAWLALLAAGSCVAQPTPNPLPTPAPASDRAPDPEQIHTQLILKDGRRITGILIDQTPEKVVLEIGGVPTTFKMDVVDRVQALPPVETQYETLRALIDPEDTEGLLRLAEWLRARGKFDLALNEVDRALKVEPANPDARDLRTLITEQKKVSSIAVHATARPRVGEAPPAPANPEFPLLTNEQINIMRVFELDLKDPPRTLIPRETITRLLDRYAGVNVEGRGQVPATPVGRELFYRLKPTEVLGWMFDLKAREFYGEVNVMDNPKSMRMFRDNVNRTWLVNSCATTKCHGGEEAGRLWLYNKQQGSDQAAYTNFFILDRFVTSSGQPLINYAEPARSPLLQMGLPRDQAVFKHPELVGANKGKWKPFFRSQQDERYQQAVDWILAMYPKRTEYPIDYKAPVPRPQGPSTLAPPPEPVPQPIPLGPR